MRIGLHLLVSKTSPALELVRFQQRQNTSVKYIAMQFSSVSLGVTEYTIFMKVADLGNVF